MIIAVDFDNALAKTDFPTIIEPIQKTIDYIKAEQGKGSKIILWTARNGDYLIDAIVWCHEHGIKFDAINDDVPEIIEKWGNNRGPKVTADLYIDDLAINVADL